MTKFKFIQKFRVMLGVVLLDLPRSIRNMHRRAWWRFSNRHDDLCFNPDGPGVYVDAPWSSDLHACRILPWLGRHMAKIALQEWPVSFQSPGCISHTPKVSFVIPHRGRERLPLLRATILSILAQVDVPVECIVVEQDHHQQLRERDLPRGTRLLHRLHPTDPAAWHFSWAFNEGTRAARADILVFHDGDILVPAGYAREIVRWLDQGWDAVYLQRILFCMNSTDTQSLCTSGVLSARWTPERVRQNWKGGTRAVRRSCFEAVGGFDESFTDWGGEDVELFDRLLAFRVYRYGYLPFVHVWHPPQAAKNDARRQENLSRLNNCLLIPREKRIAMLTGAVQSEFLQ